MIGLKIWSTNSESFKKLKELFDSGIIDYVEIYIVPDQVSESIQVLEGVPIIFHAPNYNHSFSLTNQDSVFDKSIDTIKKIISIFDEKRIIIHPGYIVDSQRDNINTLIRTLKELDFLDIIIENVPKKGYNGDVELVASTPAEFGRIIEEAGVKFCLDLGHAIAAANTHGVEPMQYIREFMKLGPYMYHLSDGDYESELDTHLHIGQGSYPLKDILSMLPNDIIMSLETPKQDFAELSEDVQNINYLRTLL